MSKALNRVGIPVSKFYKSWIVHSRAPVVALSRQKPYASAAHHLSNPAAQFISQKPIQSVNTAESGTLSSVIDMDPQLLQRLLYQEESEALDFKEEQYPFDNATDEQKGELLKDILAFANAWRQTDGYILVGVKEMRGGRSIVRGVTHHLLNRNLQQFVHSKTNRPVAFFYTPVTFENTDIGVITIPSQDRPVYVLKPYGRLEAKVVYIRRSDTTAIVNDPAELVQMGISAALARAQPTLELEFADIKERKGLGTRVQVQSHGFDVPDIQSIPPYRKRSASYLWHLDLTEFTWNEDYYRDVAKYLRDGLHLCPLGFAITNPSPTVAEDVIITLQLDTVEGLSVLDERDKPQEPSTDRMTANLRFVGITKGRHVSVSRYGNVYEVRADIGPVQPGTTAWSPESFYIGAKQSMTVDARVTISANNLRVPLSLTTQMDITADVQRIETDDILRMKGEN